MPWHINITGQHEASQNHYLMLLKQWNGALQRGAINIGPLPQEMFDFSRYRTSFQIMYSMVSSKA